MASYNAANENRKAKASTPEAGLFTWDINRNTLYGDWAIANIFGFEPEHTKRGLPLQVYIDRIHPDDRPSVAKIIHDTIITGEPEHQSYRVIRPDGSVVHVLTFGHCFRDEGAIPTLYSGIVYPASDQDGVKTLLQECEILFDRASGEGQERGAKLILAAMREIACKGHFRASRFPLPF